MTGQESKERIHFIGIGGIGMSGLARMHLTLGHEVQGSDLKMTPLLEELERIGAKVQIGHQVSNVDGATCVVYSSSIAESHPERLEAKRRHLRILHRAEALAELCRGKFTIAVTGTHGKTTTTALIGMVLREAGRDPSVIVGGLVRSFGGNACCGNGGDIVIEADESDSSFLKFSPDIEVITNIEAEHLDHFRDLAHIQETYRAFVQRLPESGQWFGCADDERVWALAGEGLRKCRLYGFKNGSNVTAENIEECPNGERGVSFDLKSDGQVLGRVRMKIIGRHNVTNALGAAAVALELGIPFPVIASALSKYEGASRRFDVKFETSQLRVVEDYAHHPTEIRRTLAAARALKPGRIVALFQPHRYTRTQALLNDFAESFADADRVVITDVYAAGEKPIEGVSGQRLVDAMNRAGHRSASYIERSALCSAAMGEIRQGDLVIALGAGDIGQVAEELALTLGGFGRLRGSVRRHEPLSKHTSLRVGGPADFWIEPADIEDLESAMLACRERGIAVFVFGNGSNLLPSDDGLRGAVIHLGSPFFKKIEINGEIIKAFAGVPNTLFIQSMVDAGLGGCEFLLGIPGNIGGAVAMNAGSHGQSIDAFTEEIEILDFDGRRRVLKKGEIPFRYRSSGLERCVVLSATLRLPYRDKKETLALLEQYREHRARTQDLQRPSAGCMFKNPDKPGCFSGRMIEEAGMKGRRVGQAQVSERHANFIVNLGGAAASDVAKLMREVSRAVEEKFEIKLEPEVKILNARGGIERL